MACCTSMPYFVTSDRERYAMSSVADDLLMYDSEDGENVWRKYLPLVSEITTTGDITGPSDVQDKTLSVLAYVSSCSETCPLLNDCMWSAGMLPPDLKAATPPARPSHDDCVSLTSANDTDMDTAVVCTAVDPSLISPCPHVPHLPMTSSPGALHVTSTPPCTDTDDEDTATAANETESSDEVDVVSVPSRSSRLEPSSSSISRPVSVVRELLVLPRACSLLARVTAMHNYSSCSSSTPYTSTTASCPGRGIYSAPQSPSVPPRQRLDRGCVSTPASPSPAATTTTTTVRRSRRRRPARRSQRRVTATWESSESDDSDSGGSSGDHTASHVGGCGKRAHHNVLERRRRDHLKYSFEALRAVVPGSTADGRVPKVVILRRARDYVRQLTSASQRLCAEYSRLKGLHQRWTYKLSLITRHAHLPQHGADDNLSTSIVQAAA